MRQLAVLVLASFMIAACGGDDPEPAAQPAQAQAADAPAPPKAGDSVFWDGGTIEQEFVADSAHEGNSIVALSVTDDEVQSGSFAKFPTFCEGLEDRVDVAQDLSGTMPIGEGSFELEGTAAEGSLVDAEMTITGDVTAQGRASGTASVSGIVFRDGATERACEDVEMEVELRAPEYVAPLAEPAEEYFGSGENGDPVALRLSPEHDEIVTARAQHVLVCPPDEGRDVVIDSNTTATAYEPAPIKPDGSFELSQQYETTRAALFVDDERVEGGGMLFTTIRGRLDGGQIVDAEYSAYMDWFEGYEPSGGNGFGRSDKGGLSFECGIEGDGGKPTDGPIQLDLAG